MEVDIKLQIRDGVPVLKYIVGIDLDAHMARHFGKALGQDYETGNNARVEVPFEYTFGSEFPSEVFHYVESKRPGCVKACYQALEQWSQNGCSDLERKLLEECMQELRKIFFEKA
jgi:hypothetical protein